MHGHRRGTANLGSPSLAALAQGWQEELTRLSFKHNLGRSRGELEQNRRQVKSGCPEIGSRKIKTQLRARFSDVKA